MKSNILCSTILERAEGSKEWKFRSNHQKIRLPKAQWNMRDGWPIEITQHYVLNTRDEKPRQA